MQLDHLLCVPNPYENESINGYIQRVALENYYENANWIYSLKKIKLNFKKRLEVEKDIMLLSELLNKDYSKLYSLTYLHIFSKKKDWLPFLLRHGINNHSKYCPKCFIENGYHNKYWDISYNIFCSKHNLRLIDMCPNCKKFISSNLKDMNSCQCGFLLHDLPRINIPIEHSNVGKLIEDIFNYGQHNNKGCLKNLTPDAFSYMILFIINQIYSDRYKEQAKVSTSFTNTKEYTEVIVDAIKIFTSWPTSFYQFLDEYGKTAKRKGRKTGITTYFGNFYLKLYSQYTDPCFDFLRDEFENYIKANFNKGYFRRFSNFEVSVGETNYISGVEASKLLKVNHNAIPKLINEGLIKGVIESVGKQVFINVKYDSLLEYKELKESHISLPEVVSILGVNKFVILKLYDMGEISGFEKQKNKKTIQILFNKDSVLSLLQKFERNLVIKKEMGQEDRMINFNSCIHSWGCMQRSFSELIEKILSNEISPLGKGEGVGLQSYLFSKVDLEEVIQRDLLLFPKDAYSIKEACQILKTDNKIIAHYHKEDIIKVNKINSKKVLINREELELFMKKYITLSEIAKVLKKNSRKLLNEIKRMDIIVVLAPTRNYHGYLFYRDEINRKLHLPSANKL